MDRPDNNYLSLDASSHYWTGFIIDISHLVALYKNGETCSKSENVAVSS